VNISALRGHLQTADGATAVQSDIIQGAPAQSMHRLDPDLVDVDLSRLHDLLDDAAAAVDPAERAALRHQAAAFDTGECGGSIEAEWLSPHRDTTARHLIDTYSHLAETEPDHRIALALLHQAVRLAPHNELLYQAIMRRRRRRWHPPHPRHPHPTARRTAPRTQPGHPQPRGSNHPAHPSAEQIGHHRPVTSTDPPHPPHPASTSPPSSTALPGVLVSYHESGYPQKPAPAAAGTTLQAAVSYAAARTGRSTAIEPVAGHEHRRNRRWVMAAVAATILLAVVAAVVSNAARTQEPAAQVRAFFAALTSRDGDRLRHLTGCEASPLCTAPALRSGGCAGSVLEATVGPGPSPAAARPELAVRSQSSRRSYAHQPR
jgi:hypothetical protein